jgi:hypothetical protein
MKFELFDGESFNSVITVATDEYVRVGECRENAEGFWTFFPKDGAEMTCRDCMEIGKKLSVMNGDD